MAAGPHVEGATGRDPTQAAVASLPLKVEFEDLPILGRSLRRRGGTEGGS